MNIKKQAQNTLLRSLVILVALITYSSMMYAKKSVDEELNRMIKSGENAYNAGNVVEAIKQFMKARELATVEKKPHDQCLSTYNLGVCYFVISENGEALKKYYEAYEICKTHNLGWKTESNILNGIAGVYFEEKDYQKARGIAYKCYKNATSKRDTSLAYTYVLDMALISNKEKKFSEAARYLREAQKLSRNDGEDKSRMLAVAAETMFLQNKYDEVISIAKEMSVNKYASKDDKSIIWIYLINVYTSRKELAKAFDYVNPAMKMTGLKNKPYLFESVAKLYKAAGDYKNALNYMDSLVIYNDSITTATNRQLTENSKIKIEVMKFKTDMDKQMSRMQQRHYILVLIMCILVLLVTIIIIMMRNQRVKSRNQHRMMELQLEKEQHEKELAEEQARSVELEAHYRQEMMKHSLEQKQKELSMTNMFMTSRNELIENLLKDLTDIKDVQDIPAVKVLVQHLKQLLKTSNERDNFIINFESANPDFIRTLKDRHPDLSSSDIRFLSYIRMNMSTKDIASLININPESCKRRKIRISKKLGIESSANLYNYIINM